MAAPLMNHGPVAASKSERPAVAEIEHLLETSRSSSAPKLMGPSGELVEVPESVVRVLRQAVQAMAQDQAVAVVPVQKQLTTQEAADLLGVSRPYLVRLLEQGVIPFTKTGTHRRIGFDDLLAYKGQRDTDRRKALTRLTRMSQEMGLYSDKS
jgi:excisionase family DNA binding protein